MKTTLLLFTAFLLFSLRGTAQLASLTENFNSYGQGQWPSDWTRSSTYVGIAGNQRWIYSGFDTNDGTISTHDVVSPEIADIKNKQLKFDVLNNAGVPLRMEIYLSGTNAATDPNADIFQVILLDQASEYYKFIPITIDMTSLNLSGINNKNYFRFRFYEVSGQPIGIGIDNIEIQTAVNSDPTNILLNGTNINENNNVNAVIGVLSTTDANSGDSHTYTLSGTDASHFNINGNQLRASTSFNYENRNSYSVSITTDDGKGGTFTKTFNIAVNNENEQAISVGIPKSYVNRNASAGTSLGAIAVNDPDAGDSHTFSISGTHSALFKVENGQLKIKNAITPSTPKNLSLTITATDLGGLSKSSSFTVKVNDKPTDIQPNTSGNKDTILVANTSTGLIIQLLTQDPDAGDNHSYSIVQNMSPALSINGNNVSVATGSHFSNAAPDTTSVTIRSNDGKGGILDKKFVVVVLEMLKLSSYTIEEGQAIGTVVGNVISDYQNGPVPGKNVKLGGPDAASFEINSSGQLITKEVFDASDKHLYNITLQLITDQGFPTPHLEGVLSFTIKVTGEGVSGLFSNSPATSLIYPNPATNTINLPFKNASIKIFTTEGKQVWQSKVSGDQFTLPGDILSGNYVIMLQNETQFYTQKLTVQ